MTNNTYRNCTRLAVVVAALTAFGPAIADVLVILDASGSSPVMESKSAAYLDDAAQRVSPAITTQPLGARLLVVTVGEYGKAEGKLLDKQIQRYATSAGGRQLS
jgi:hypothetical protein